jgi:AraC family transcriptional regulator, regulatory protein of adaptative response / methylated-DNA-[protein]-cysteine methyltransferase
MMNQSALPDNTIMYKALLERDSSFEGTFFVGVKTTGIFCRPTCRAKKPKEENIEFFASVKEAMSYGYRPCKLCNPLEYKGEMPEWLKPLIFEINNNPSIKIRDMDLLKKGINPHRIRRWFKENLNMTFQAYLRTSRINKAFGKIKFGDEKVVEAAFSSDYESLSGFNSTFKKTTGFTPVESKNKNLIQVTRILTPLGPMLAGAINEKICLLEFTDRRMLETQLKRIKKIFKTELVPGNSFIFKELNKELEEYFNGERKIFNIPLSIEGTPFQVKVWNELLKIPYGRTVSYKTQAININNPKAVRAVGKANGDNRISIIVPCHRVIGSNGELINYGGGIWRKQYLINLEMKNLDQSLVQN